GPDGSTWPTPAVVRPPELAVCWQLEDSHLFTRGEKPRDAAWTSLIPVETCRPPLVCRSPHERDVALSIDAGRPSDYSSSSRLRRRGPPARVTVRAAWSISRRWSRSRSVARLSCSFLPRPRPSSTLARPCLK